MMDLVDIINGQWAKERPDLFTDELGLINRIVVLEKYLQHFLTEALTEFDLTVWEFDVLATLLRQGAPYCLSATQLATSAMLSASAMTNRVDRLSARNLVVREPAEIDRRAVYVKLTELGHELANQALTARAKMARQLTESLTKSDIATANRLLRHLLCSLEPVSQAVD